MLKLQKWWLVGIVISICLLCMSWFWITPADVVRKICVISTNNDIQRTTGSVTSMEPDLRKLAQHLMEIQRSNILSAQENNKIGSHIQVIMNMLNRLNDNIAGILDANSSVPKRSQEVCPEEFKGKRLNYGYPFFRKGFGRVDCKDFVPIEKLVTLLISMPEELPKPAQSYLEVMEGVAKYFPKVRVLLATEKALKEPVQSSISKLNIFFEHDIINGIGESALWKRLIAKATTPYVLIAPDITHFDDDINLERLVRLLSYEPAVAIAGAAHRNLKGEWDMGCQQVVFQNWTASYQGGYYRSFNDCVVCDYISGPFMAKTATLKDLPFDNNLKYGAFRDLFWRIKKEKSGKFILSCPDVMFRIRDRKVEDVEYVSFANKHKIHKIVEPNGRVRWYGCRNGFSYTSAGLCSKVKGIGLSPASMENLADTIKFCFRVCEEAGAFCEMQDGTSVGAVKFNGVLPWELDGDIVFQSANFSVFEKLTDKFKKAGYSLRVGSRTKMKDGRATGGYFYLGTTNWNVELWGYSAFESQMAVARGLVPTKVLFAGQWVNFPRNPGLFIRNRYGAGIYKHQEHWSRVGLNSGWQFYKPGSFAKCPVPGHSACLDQYPADGNMQFRNYPRWN